MYSDDLDSVTNNLRDSAKGSNDGYDVAFPLTVVQMETRITVGLLGRPRGCCLHWPWNGCMDRVEDEFRGFGCHTRVFFFFSVCEKEVRVPSSVPFACCMPQP